MVENGKTADTFLPDRDKELERENSKNFVPSNDYIPENIGELLAWYDQVYFEDLLGCVTIRWSKRMTLCAGICKMQADSTCEIALSEPLLKYRTPQDLHEVLLHEMIHAYLWRKQFSSTGFKAILDRTGHGPDFVSMMNKINRSQGLGITVYHSFIDEVNHYKKHVWRCTGICKTRPPFYGYVRRSMNRVPGPNDRWHEAHRASCGGSFVKESSDESTQQPQIKKLKVERSKQANAGEVLGSVSELERIPPDQLRRKHPLLGTQEKIT